MGILIYFWTPNSATVKLRSEFGIKCNLASEPLLGRLDPAVASSSALAEILRHVR
jgi:hypothetical protein